MKYRKKEYLSSYIQRSVTLVQLLVPHQEFGNVISIVKIYERKIVGFDVLEEEHIDSSKSYEAAGFASLEVPMESVKCNICIYTLYTLYYVFSSFLFPFYVLYFVNNLL